ncbi:MAG: hypothetical protein ABJG86_00575 [Nitratireductor sp.]|uniref:hypothetical protein n=1 Tax=Parvibaculum sp. TaxID=2024848 RepID=UPI00326C2956
MHAMTAIETVSPAQANDWLKGARNTGKLDKRTVGAYAADMAAGRWKLNGEPIIIGRSGQLLSGRLRLAACAQSGAAFPALIVRGIEDANFETIDAVRRRTVGDILTIRKEPDGRALAAALSTIWRYLHKAFDRKHATRFSAQQLLEILEAHPEVRLSLALTKDVAPVLPHGLATALHYLFSCVDGEKATQFFQEICDPADANHPAPQLLRRQMEAMRAQGGARSQQFMIGLTVKAWEAFRANKPTSLLRYVVGNEDLPTITDLPKSLLFEPARPASAPNGLAVKQMASSMVARIEEITPERASALLERNDGNRRIAAAVVDKYARDINADNWQLNGQTIKIGHTGRLLDGQHRCAAAVRSGRSFRTIIVEGLDEEVFDTFDLGASRSVADILIDRREQNTSVLAATLRQVWLLRNGLIQLRTATPSVAELLNVLETEPEIRESVRNSHKIRTLMAPALGCALHYLFSRSNAGKAQKFVDRLGDGADLHKGDPILMLREKLIRDRGSKKRSMADAERAAVIIKAWNAFVAGSKLHTLRWINSGPRREEFPTIAGGGIDHG